MDGEAWTGHPGVRIADHAWQSARICPDRILRCGNWTDHYGHALDGSRRQKNRRPKVAKRLFHNLVAHHSNGVNFAKINTIGIVFHGFETASKPLEWIVFIIGHEEDSNVQPHARELGQPV